METWLDLHMHTRYSMDGQFEPADLMRQCAAAGLRAVAVTDHDSVSAVGEAWQAAHTLGLHFFPGIDISCQYVFKYIHLLCYGIHADEPVFKRIEETIHAQRLENSEKILDAVEALGIAIDRQAVWNMASSGVVASVNIAKVALEDSRNDGNPLLAPYRPGGTRGDAPYVNFGWDFCGQGGPAFVPMQLMPFADAVAAVQENGGAAVLAHPGANMGKNQVLTEKLLAAGIDGIEVYCSYHDEDTSRFYRQIADRHGVIPTVGSDYHGRAKPYISLGQYAHPEPQSVYDRLCRIIQERKGDRE